uniref:Uncharacterized protein n=1 Tax=Arundo donax TaxID=35708 RepID=A0A0A8Z3M8_ARUDO
MLRSAALDLLASGSSHSHCGSHELPMVDDNDIIILVSGELSIVAIEVELCG